MWICPKMGAERISGREAKESEIRGAAETGISSPQRLSSLPRHFFNHHTGLANDPSGQSAAVGAAGPPQPRAWRHAIGTVGAAKTTKAGRKQPRRRWRRLEQGAGRSRLGSSSVKEPR